MQSEQTPIFTPEAKRFFLLSEFTQAATALEEIVNLSEDELALLVTTTPFALQHGKLSALLMLLNQLIFLLPNKAADDLDRPPASSAAVVGQGGN